VRRIDNWSEIGAILGMSKQLEHSRLVST